MGSKRLEAFLAKPTPSKKRCETCQLSKELVADIAEFWRLRQAGQTDASIAYFHTAYLRPAGYPLTLAALGNHLRSCLSGA